MILHGNQRGGATGMGKHLLNTQDNEHVSVHEVKGFMAADLMGALRETEATAKGTKCRQYLYSCSFNPPQTVDASIADFEEAFDRAEEVLGLGNPPRSYGDAEVEFSRQDERGGSDEEDTIHRDADHGCAAPDGGRCACWGAVP
jgi:hypothetical protein